MAMAAFSDIPEHGSKGGGPSSWGIRIAPLRFGRKTGSGKSGAQERTRTFTAVKPLAPEASASTNSTTWARSRLVRIGRALVKLAPKYAVQRGGDGVSR